LIVERGQRDDGIAAQPALVVLDHATQ